MQYRIPVKCPQSLMDQSMSVLTLELPVGWILGLCRLEGVLVTPRTCGSRSVADWRVEPRLEMTLL